MLLEVDKLEADGLVRRVPHVADRRTLCWALGLCPLLPSFAYVWPALAPWLLPAALGLAYSVGAIVNAGNFRATLDFWGFDFKNPLVAEPVTPPAPLPPG